MIIIEYQKLLNTYYTTNLIMKKFKLLQELPNYQKELPKCNTETWSEQMMLGKWKQQSCSMQGGHKLSICKKYNICKSAIQSSMPIY